MKKGLQRALDILNKEILAAQDINSTMALGMVQIECLIKKEIDSIDQNNNIDDYFTSAKGSGGEMVITVLKTEGIYKDLPLFGACIVINFGIELLATRKLERHIDIIYPNISKDERLNLYTDIATSLWEEYGSMTMKEVCPNGILNF